MTLADLLNCEPVSTEKLLGVQFNGTPQVIAKSNFVCDLSAMTIIAISGNDAEVFLSNQFASKVAPRGTHSAQLSCWCDPKGRVLFMFYLICGGDTYYCILPTSSADSFSKRLKMFVLRAEVTIDINDSMKVSGVFFAEDAPASSIETSTTERFASQQIADDCFCIRLDDALRRYLLLGTQPAFSSISLADTVTGSAEAWGIADIASGILVVDVAHSGDFLPQNLNLDVLDVISFSKGCYPGQEIIARLKYRGKVKQRLAFIYGEWPRDWPGDSIAGEKPQKVFQHDKNVGEVLNSQRIAEHFIGLAVLDTGALDPPMQSITDDDGNQFAVACPPYLNTALS